MSNPVWIQAKDIVVGQRFKLEAEGIFLTRVKPTFPLRNRREWDSGTGPAIPSIDHVLAVSDNFSLTAVHPDNHVMPF